MIIEAVTVVDLPEIRDLLARSNDARYDLAAVAEEKCFGLGVAGPPEVRVARMDDLAAGIAVTCGRHVRVLAVDRQVRRLSIGSALLTDAERRIQLRGHARAVIGAEPGNYFTPGVNMGDAPTLEFLERRGYAKTAFTANLEVSLTENRLVPASPPSTVTRANHEQRGLILDAIEREFGRAWRFETERAFQREEPAVFVAGGSGAIAGFAAHDANNRGLGFFGPTGVIASQRGHGLGRDLLHASLADLRRLGHTRAVIPWTDAADFYRKSCGATVTHRFAIMTRALDQ